MAYQYRQHPNYDSRELCVMGHAAVDGKMVNTVGIVPVPKSGSGGGGVNGQTTQTPTVEQGSPWSSGMQSQLLAAGAVLGLMYFLR